MLSLKGLTTSVYESVVNYAAHHVMGREQGGYGSSAGNENNRGPQMSVVLLLPIAMLFVRDFSWIIRR
jgi:hypothetical protein